MNRDDARRNIENNQENRFSDLCYDLKKSSTFFISGSLLFAQSLTFFLALSNESKNDDSDTNQLLIENILISFSSSFVTSLLGSLAGIHLRKKIDNQENNSNLINNKYLYLAKSSAVSLVSGLSTLLSESQPKDHKSLVIGQICGTYSDIALSLLYFMILKENNNRVQSNLRQDSDQQRTPFLTIVANQNPSESIGRNNQEIIATRLSSLSRPRPIESSSTNISRNTSRNI